MTGVVSKHSHPLAMIQGIFALDQQSTDGEDCLNSFHPGIRDAMGPFQGGDLLSLSLIIHSESTILMGWILKRYQVLIAIQFDKALTLSVMFTREFWGVSSPRPHQRILQP